MHVLINNRGFSLIEAMISVLLIATGILAVMGMQVQSIRANATAQSRTLANDVTISLLETIKRLPFDEPILVATGASLPSQYDPGNLPSAANSRLITDADGNGQPEAHPVLDRMFQFSANSPQLVDLGGKGISAYQTARIAIVDNALGTGEVPSKTVRLFLAWNAAMGTGMAEITAIKYRNISL